MATTQSNPNQHVKIGKTVCENTEFLRALACTKSCRKRKKLLRTASSDQLLSLVEICLNIVQSRFHLTTRQKKRLLPYADFVRRMSRVRSERGARRLLNKQIGGGIIGVPLIAALVTPILMELAKSIISE